MADPSTSQSEKLQKVLASHGFGSRRVMEQWIKAGRIKVNGQLATIGDRVSGDDRIAVDGRLVSQKTVRHRILLYNKPAGEICSRDDPEGRPSVYRKLPRIRNQRWVSVGRLDFNTTGLLLFTTDGELANRLMHPSAQIEREYAVRVLGEVTDRKLQHMREGVLLEDGVAAFSDIRKGKDEGSANQWYYVVLMEGRNREVRRLWESQGLTVSRLKRVRYGSFFIPSAIKAGQYRELKTKESKELYKMSTAPPVILTPAPSS
jgi:23S rRNA pseudouridine2605 synthase